jgi:hypothetical protein
VGLLVGVEVPVLVGVLEGELVDVMLGVGVEVSVAVLVGEADGELVGV